MAQQYAHQNTLALHKPAQTELPNERLFSNRDLFLLIGPLVIEQLLSILTGLVDSIMVAQVGEAAVSGVSLIDNIMVLLITAASIPFLAIYNAGAAIFRTIGNARITMKISLLSNGINIVGNALCIYGLNMGVEGVAIPTLVSRLISALIVSGLLLNGGNTLSLERNLHHHFDWNMVRRILKIGIPSGLENGMFQLGKIMLLSLVSGFGTAAMTANAVSGVLAAFQVLPGQAVGLAETTVISRCVGANDYKQVRYYNKKLLLITYVLLWCFDLLILFALGPILGLYHLTQETETLTRQLIWLHTIGAMIIWPLTFDLPSMFRAAGDVRFAMVTSIVSMWLFRLLTGYVLALFFDLGVIGVWLAMMVDWMFRAILFTWRYFSGKWQNYRAV